MLSSAIHWRLLENPPFSNPIGHWRTTGVGTLTLAFLFHHVWSFAMVRSHDAVQPCSEDHKSTLSFSNDDLR